MATTSIADKLAKLEKKIAKREKTIAEEQAQLDKETEEYNKLYLTALASKYKLSGKDLFSAIEREHDQLEKLREDMQKQIDEAYKKAENINSNAAKNQQALDGYTQGMLISLDMRNENGTDKLYISRNDEDIMTVTTDEDISGRLIALFEGLGAADGEVMLAAVVYDGDAVLYRNMRIVENAVQAVSDKYENVYFTYINTSKLNGQ